MQSIGNESTQGKHKRIFVTIVLLRPINIIRNSFVFNYDWWMREISHEVGHIKQIGRDKSLTLYLVKTIFGYVSTLSHDKSPREIEAEKGAENYEDFRDYVKTNLKSNIINLLRSNKSEKEKIQQIDKWWSEYQQKKK